MEKNHKEAPKFRNHIGRVFPKFLRSFSGISFQADVNMDIILTLQLLLPHNSGRIGTAVAQQNCFCCEKGHSWQLVTLLSRSLRQQRR